MCVPSIGACSGRAAASAAAPGPQRAVPARARIDAPDAPRLRGDFRLDLTIVTNQQVLLTIQGESNRFNTVEISTNLLNWVEWQTFLNSNGVFTLLDTAPTNVPARFYRALQHAATNGSGFNTLMNFNLTMESAANPSCGCSGEPTYGQGVSLVAEGCADCGTSEKVSGLGQDTGFGSVLLYNGELAHYVVEFAIAGRSFNWEFARKYQSGIGFNGPLGGNWEFNYNRRLLVETNGNVLRMDGFARADRYLLLTNGAYEAPRAFYTKLAK